MAEFSIFAGTPQLQNNGNGEVLSLGTEFFTGTDAWVTHLRYLNPAYGEEPALKTMALYDGAGTIVAGPLLMPPGVSGQWTAAALEAPYKLVPGVRYKVVTFHPNGGYTFTAHYFNEVEFGPFQTSGPLSIPSSAQAVPPGAQGSFSYAGDAISYPVQGFSHSAYYSDVIVSDTDPAPAPSSTIFTLINGALVPVSPQL